MGVAKRYRKAVLPRLAGIEEELPFEDRVLLWLAPDWSDDVQKYHRANGKALAEWLQPHQLEHLDEHYYSVLKSRLGRQSRSRRRPLAIWYKQD